MQQCKLHIFGRRYRTFLARSSYLERTTVDRGYDKQCITTQIKRKHATQLSIPVNHEFKLAVLVYHCLQGTAPSYLADELCRVADIPARQRLRSASTAALDVPVTRCSTMGDRSSLSLACASGTACLPSSHRPRRC